MRSQRPIAIDLFAGAGGFSLGLEQAGFDVAIAVEKDPVHAAIHRFNFPQTRVFCEDITQLSGERLWQGVKSVIPTATELDLLVGGPPCQGFSSMGKREKGDERNNLVFEFSRLVKELQPRYFVMENVPGLKQGTALRVLRRLKRELKQGGYQITERVKILNAAKFGVPQERKRLFLLGSRLGEVKLQYPRPLREEAPTVQDAIADLPNIDDFTALATVDELYLTPQELKQLEAQISPYGRHLRNPEADPKNYAYPRHWDAAILTGLWQTQHSEETKYRFQETPPGKQEKISRLRRLDWQGHCTTLRAGTNSDRGSHTSARPLHPEYHRVICVREAARLHSFPDWFRFHFTKWHGFRQVGNAVPPLLARAIAQQVMIALNQTPLKPTQVLTLGDKTLLHLTHTQAQEYWLFVDR